MGKGGGEGLGNSQKRIKFSRGSVLIASSHLDSVHLENMSNQYVFNLSPLFHIFSFSLTFFNTNKVHS